MDVIGIALERKALIVLMVASEGLLEEDQAPNNRESPETEEVQLLKFKNCCMYE